MFRVFCFALALFAFAVPAAAQGPQRPEPLCSKDRLAQELSDSDSWYEMIRIKRQHGFIPSPAKRREMEQRIKADTGKLTSALENYASDGGALALVYGGSMERRDIEQYLRSMRGHMRSPRGIEATHINRALRFGGGAEFSCVWLVGAEGVVASGYLTESTNEATYSLWSGLQVAARSRASRSPREVGRACPPYKEASTAMPAASAGLLRSADHSLRKTAKQLLPGAVQDGLATSGGPHKRLLIFPKGNLRKVPFAALPVRGRPLIDSFVPIIAPSIASVAAKRTSPAKRPATDAKALIIGNPDLQGDPENCWAPLPGAETEARYVAGKLSDAKLVVGAEASNAAIVDQLKSGDNFNLLYIATHGISDPENPADGSYLALTDGHLRGAQLRDIQLIGNPLVILSACQTGLGKEFDQGVFGLPEAWHFAGSDRIIMSLWDVSDQGTQQLMREFVDIMAAQSWEKSDLALAQSMRIMKEKHPDPMIWAAFAFYGTPDL